MTVKIKISWTIANEYATRCPDHIPGVIRDAGIYELTLEQARIVAEDAEFNSDTKNVDVGPYGMPLTVFNSYRALARQVRRALAAGGAS